MRVDPFLLPLVFGATTTSLLLAAVAYLVVRDSVRRKGLWGINFSAPACRHCGTLPPRVRVPDGWDQMLWGGWTCPECGLEVDKWGEPVADQLRPAKWKLDRPAPPPADRAKPSDRITRPLEESE